jgi:hypothetical protein
MLIKKKIEALFQKWEYCDINLTSASLGMGGIVCVIYKDMGICETIENANYSIFKNTISKLYKEGWKYYKGVDSPPDQDLKFKVQHGLSLPDSTNGLGWGFITLRRKK